jgi:TetR/AcrR family transcriptional regulator, transcriptional repressor for nem operon
MTDRKTTIIQAASALIGDHGFKGTSVDDVIREAGLSGKAHFYHYFRSKEELGYAVLQFQFDRFADRGLAILREPMIDPLDRLDLFIETVVAAHAERGCRGGSPLFALALEMADAHEGFRERLEAVFERWASQIESLLWEARSQLVNDLDVARLSRFIIATLEGALMVSRVKREITVLEGIAEELKRYVRSYVRDRALVVAGL